MNPSSHNKEQLNAFSTQLKKLRWSCKISFMWSEPQTFKRDLSKCTKICFLFHFAPSFGISIQKCQSSYHFSRKTLQRNHFLTRSHRNSPRADTHTQSNRPRVYGHAARSQHTINPSSPELLLRAPHPLTSPPPQPQTWSEAPGHKGSPAYTVAQEIPAVKLLYLSFNRQDHLLIRSFCRWPERGQTPSSLRIRQTQKICNGSPHPLPSPPDPFQSPVWQERENKHRPLLPF